MYWNERSRQDHFFQFKNDQFQYINHNRPNRTFDFIPISRNLQCQVLGAPQTSGDLDFISWLIVVWYRKTDCARWCLPC